MGDCFLSAADVVTMGEYDRVVAEVGTLRAENARLKAGLEKLLIELRKVRVKSGDYVEM